MGPCFQNRTFCESFLKNTVRILKSVGLGVGEEGKEKIKAKLNFFVMGSGVQQAI